MEAIEFVNSISTGLIAILSVGGGFMALVESIKMIMADDEGDSARAKKNIKTILKAVILGLSVTGLIKILFSTLGG